MVATPVTPLAAYTDIQNVLGGVTIADDARAASLLQAASDTVAVYLGHDPNQRSAVTETLTPPHKQAKNIWLPEQHVTAVSSVSEDGTALTEGNDEDYLWNVYGRLTRVGTVWYSAKPEGISVTYTAGWETIPEQIVLAVAQIAARMWAVGAAYAAVNAAGAEGFKSETMPDGYKYQVQDDVPLGVALESASMISGAERVLLAGHRRRF